MPKLHFQLHSSPIETTKKPGADSLKRGPDQFFLNVYTGNNQVRLMIEKCNSAHAQNHRRARQAHMKKIVLNEDAFTQCFRTAKGVRSCFFFFGVAMAPKLEKSESGSIS